MQHYAFAGRENLNNCTKLLRQTDWTTKKNQTLICNKQGQIYNPKVF